MTTRREARRTVSAAVASSVLPPDLALGPCVEVWASKPALGADRSPDWFRASRAWHQAIVRWAQQSGYASEKVPATNAANLARTKHHWSRQELLDAEEFEWLDYYEGQGPKPAGPPPWQRNWHKRGGTR